MGSSRHKVTLTDIGTSQTTIGPGQHNQNHKERLTLSLFDGNLKTLVNYFKEHYIYHEDDNAFLESVFNILENVSHQDLKTNKVDENIEEQVALELLQTAHKYNISKLEAVMLNTVYSKPDEWLSIGNVLHLYLYSRNVDGFCYEMLRQRLLNIMKKFHIQLKDSEEFKRFVNAGAQVETDTEFAEVMKLCMSA